MNYSIIHSVPSPIPKVWKDNLKSKNSKKEQTVFMLGTTK